VLSADHLNKADVGASISRQWIDVDKVDAIADVANSAVSLAVSEVVKGANKVLLVTGGVTARLTGDACSPNTVHWAMDTWALASAPISALLKQGGDTWYFITADYTFGHDLERQAAGMITEGGGKVVGSTKHPLQSADFSSFLLQAQASPAKVIAFANSQADFINAAKQAAEFNITQGGRMMTGLADFIPEIHALGLQAAQGMVVAEPWYWNLDATSREFAKRFAGRFNGKMPSSQQVGTYSAVLHYLKTVDAMKGAVDDGRAVVAKMKELPTDDPIFGKGYIRADGRKIHPIYAFQVKKPAESKEPWDYYSVLRKVPGEEAFRPIERGGCPLVKK
jgi:branched-chain amino acid transport system substrate-binding protein